MFTVPILALQMLYTDQVYLVAWDYKNMHLKYHDTHMNKVAKLAHENFIEDQHSWLTYGCLYEAHIIDTTDKVSEDCETKQTENNSSRIQTNKLYCLAFCNTYTNKSSTDQSFKSGISYCIEAHISPRVCQGGVTSDALISDKHIRLFESLCS